MRSSSVSPSSPSKSRPPGRVLAVLAAILLATAARPAARGQEPRPARATTPAPADARLQIETAIHVHTRATTGGRLTPTEIAELARREGVEAVVYTDTLVRDTRYAPWPLRYLFEVRRTAPSLVDYGVGTFLEELQAARARFPELLLLPGVEVTPYYWWSGSLLEGRLVLHDFQRDLIVVPGPGPVAQARELISGLPVIDNPGARGWGVNSLVELAPGLVLVWLGFRGLRERRPLSRGAATGRAGRGSPGGAGEETEDEEDGRGGRLRRARGILALAAGIALLYHHYPFTEAVYRPYDPDLREPAEQRLIDHVRERGGLVLWSTPEVDNSGSSSVGPVRVELDSPPHVDGLVDSRRWNAFGGVYAHGIEAIEPGGLWDELLLEHVRGRRASAPWMVGESDFRYTGQAGKFLSEVLTVLLVPERTPEATLAALGQGTSYALRQTEDDGLRLAALTVSTADGGATAGPGERLDAPPGAGLEIHVAVESRSGDAVPCRVRLVGAGRIVDEWEATTPFTRRIVETAEAGPGYYRLDVHGPRPIRLVTNPVIVGR